MRQDFHDGAGQVAGGDINNYGVNIGLNGKAESRGLVSAQRKELHELRAKCEELGDDPREVWRMVHAQLGVTTISEISADQFPLARSTIQTRLEQLQEEADKRRLVGKILRAVSEKDLKAEMNNFCELNFGRTQLCNLEKPQLQKTLEYVLQHQTAKQCLEPLQVPLATSFLDFYFANKKNSATLFLLGLLIGSIWF